MQFINSKQLAQMLGISARTVEKWGQRKGMPRVKLARSCVRYNSTEVFAWLAARGCFQNSFTAR
ncbi:MAG: helix-turn-helix transcriptional regulator [Desulfomonilaceae bacterium]